MQASLTKQTSLPSHTSLGPYIPQHYSMFTFNDDYEFAERTRQDVGYVCTLFESYPLID